MSTRFEPGGRLVLVPVYLLGPAGGAKFQFALDTAATRTAVSGLVLESLGYQPEQARGRHQVRTGSGGTTAGLLRVSHLAALDRLQADHPVLWLSLPPASMIDGLLGLDFFRGHVLTIDFVRGRITLRPPRPRWRFWR